MDVRYSLDYACQLLLSFRPTSVYIHSRSPSVVRAVVSRIAREDLRIVVENEKIQLWLASELGTDSVVLGNHVPDSVLYPFSVEEGAKPIGARVQIFAVRNLFSYKKLLYPSLPVTTLGKTLRALGGKYSTTTPIGVFHPAFLLYYTASLFLERIRPDLSLILLDHAMVGFFESRFPRRFAFIVIFAAVEEAA